MVLILRWSYFRGGLIARFYCIAKRFCTDLVSAMLAYNDSQKLSLPSFAESESLGEDRSRDPAQMLERESNPPSQS